MCGICGVLNLNSTAADGRVVEAMMGMLEHRGPDEMGVFTQESVGLGHRRLSIIDVAGGQQPMSAGSDDLWISFNGEIFNYIEMRQELEKRGHRFRTQSDTEVILQAYKEFGDECVHRLNGQWAFALWDQKEQRLFLSRDRLGVRPLFYTVKDQAFIFASEIKAILAHPRVEPEIDLIGLDQLFTFWCTRAPRSIFKSIRELPPGHNLSVQNGTVRTWQYWQLNYPERFEELKEEEWACCLLDLLKDATRIRLRSDVPVGAYLSGGLDSTTLVAIIRRYTSARLKTFSVAFEDPQFDERSYQREAVRSLGTEHHEIEVTAEDIARVFPKVVWHAEKPILRSAPAPMYLLSSLVRSQGYKVVVTGEGADEVLGGYDIFKEAKIRRFWAKYPDSRLRPLLLKRLYPYLGALQSQSAAYLKAFFQVSAEQISSPVFSHLPRWELTTRIKEFFSEEVKGALDGHSSLEEFTSSLPENFHKWDCFSQSQYLEANCLFPGYILSSQGDRMAMAHSVEGRFPFLDYRVVELARRIPPNFRMKVLDEKYILKRAAKDLIPPVVRARKKQPYRAPDAASFFSNGRGREPYLDDMLSPERIRHYGLFKARTVAKLCDKIRSGQVIGTKDNMALLGILSTQLLVHQFIQKH